MTETGPAPRERGSGWVTGNTGTAICIFFILFSIYLLSASRVLHVDADEGIVFATVENIAKFGRFDIEQIASVSKSNPWEFGVDGKHYSKYGLMQSLLPVPLYMVAARLPELGNADVVLLYNAIITALTGALVFLAGRSLGYSTGTSAVVSVVFGVATFAWAYSKRLLGEPTSSLLLITSTYWLLRFVKSRHSRHLYLAGGFMGMAFAFKASNAVGLAAEMAFLAYVVRGFWPRLRSALQLLVPVAAFVALVGLYNFVRFGNPWHTGYGPHETFTTPLLHGLWGLLLSPGRSFFLYSPILILSLAGAAWMVKERRGGALLLVLSAALQILLYSTWWVWWGGWSWGPRFLVPLAPVAALLLLPVVDRVHAHKRRLALPFLGMLAISLGVQIVGVAVDHSWYLRDQSVVDPDVHGVTVSEWRYSPLLNQPRYIDLAHLDFIWAHNRLQGADPHVDYVSLVLMSGLVGLAAAVTVAIVRWRGRPAMAVVGPSLFCLMALASVGIGYVSLARAHACEVTDYRGLVAEISRGDAPADVVVFSDFLRNEEFLNLNKSEAFVIGWGEEATPSPALRQRLDEVVRRLSTSSERVGVVVHATPNRPADPGNGIERFLNERFFVSETKWFGSTRLVRYLAPGKGTRDADILEAERADNLAGLFKLRRARVVQPGTWDKESKGRPLFVTLEWESLAQTKQAYTVFVQLLTPAGKVVAQRDQMPAGNTMPTDSWVPGQIVKDNYLVLVDRSLPRGDYLLIAGMYSLADGKRLPISDSTGQAVGDFVTLATIAVD